MGPFFYIFGMMVVILLVRQDQAFSWPLSLSVTQVSLQKDLSKTFDFSSPKQNNLFLFWVNDDGAWSHNAEKARLFIQGLTHHGVDIDDLLSTLEGAVSLASQAKEKIFDGVLSKALDRALGGENRKKMHAKHPALIKKWDSQTIIETIKKDGDTEMLLSHLLSATPHYRGLQKALEHYQSLLKKSDKEGDPSCKLQKNLKKGDHGQDVALVRRYLSFYGYLEEESKTSKDVFDEEMERALKLFQEHHTEEKDGTIGARIRPVFLLTVKDRISKIKKNMERLRYLGPVLTSRYIMVNVAGYRVDAVEDGKIVLSMKSVVGMPSRKTPLFIAPLTHFIFHPTWTVPPGIFEKDKLPRLLNDPDYRDRMSAFMHSSSGLDMDQVDWYDRSTRPRLTYPPGRSNPLGQIKFHIENTFTIYLHDTNQPDYFKKTKRAKSSGCIRLEKPKELAAWLDAGGTYATVESIEKVLQHRKTSWHSLKEAISVYFVYLTNWVDDEGYLHFSDDPYGYD